MKFCTVGTGAIGGLLAGRLARAGYEVTAVDRGEHLDAIRSRGLTLEDQGGADDFTVRVPVAADCHDVGPQDVVLLAVKAHQISSVAAHLPALFDDGTVVVTLQNGLPWWYFQAHGGEHEGRAMHSLDPDGVIARHVPTERIVGCVAYPAAALVGPGVVRHVEGNRFTLGELDGTISERCERLRNALVASGFKSFVIEDIRSEIWLKAWGALAFNTVSALTGGTMERICHVPETRDLAERMMTEAQVIACKLGVRFRHTIEKRLAGAERVGAHKTSMLQDVENGKATEVDAVIGVVLELADLTDTPAPSIRAVAACCRLLNDRLANGEAGGSVRL